VGPITNITPHNGDKSSTHQANTQVQSYQTLRTQTTTEATNTNTNINITATTISNTVIQKPNVTGNKNEIDNETTQPLGDAYMTHKANHRPAIDTTTIEKQLPTQIYAWLHLTKLCATIGTMYLHNIAPCCCLLPWRTIAAV
jgi:hypothetical protein